MDGESEETAEQAPAFKLELLSSTSSREYGYVTVEGEVKNICGEKLESVMVVVSFYTDTGEFVTLEDALIEYDPIMLGQTSPWKVMDRYNRAIGKFTFAFKELFGGEIPVKDSR